MKVRNIVIGMILLLILAATGFGYTPTQQINFQNTSDPLRLERLLRDQFAALRDDISGLYWSGTGNFYYVDSAVGSSSYTGADWVHPKATLDSAVALCTANNGDVIFVASGHAENLAADDAVDLDVAGITVIGLGDGQARPKFTQTAAGTNGAFVIGAASVTIINLTFEPGVNVAVNAIAIEAAGDNATIYNCEILESATAANEFLSGIVLASGANDVHILNNRITSDDDGATGSAITVSAGVVTGLIIKDNYIFGDYDAGCIYIHQVCPNTLIEGNKVYQINTGVAAIKIDVAATGLAINNYMYADTWGTLGVTTFDPGSLMCVNNWGVNAVDKSAQRVPSASTGETIEDALMGGPGITTWPTAAAFGNGVSIAEALGYMSLAIRQNGGTSCGSSKSLVDCLGSTGSALQDDAVSIAGIIGIPTDADNAAVSTSITANADGSLYERQEYTQTMQQKTISKTISTIANGNNDLFAVAGGPIKIDEIVAYVTTTAIGAEGCLVNYNIDPTTPATDTAFGTDGTAVECNNAAVGTVLTWNGTVGADLIKTANGVAIGCATTSGLIVPIGSIELAAAHDGTITGEFTVYMRYTPLSASSVVTAAP